MKNGKVLGLALGLPSSILGVSLFSLYLSDKGYISTDIATLMIVVNIILHLYWMVKYADKKSD